MQSHRLMWITLQKITSLSCSLEEEKEEAACVLLSGTNTSSEERFRRRTRRSNNMVCTQLHEFVLQGNDRWMEADWWQSISHTLLARCVYGQCSGQCSVSEQSIDGRWSVSIRLGEVYHLWHSSLSLCLSSYVWLPLPDLCPRCVMEILSVFVCMCWIQEFIYVHKSSYTIVKTGKWGQDTNNKITAASHQVITPLSLSQVNREFLNTQAQTDPWQRETTLHTVIRTPVLRPWLNQPQSSCTAAVIMYSCTAERQGSKEEMEEKDKKLRVLLRAWARTWVLVCVREKERESKGNY